MGKKIIAIIGFTVFLIGMIVGQSKADLADGERTALEDLYNSTGGDSWDVNTNWMSGVSECDWHGITCDGDGYFVQRIELESNNLAGSLPASLANFTDLRVLDLSGNFITDPIPDLSSLDALWRIDLGQNNIGGNIPTHLSGVTLLQDLLLGDNELDGEITIPTASGELAALSTLYLSRNRLEGTIPTEIGGLESLKYLYLSGNKLEGPIPGNLDDDLADTLLGCNIRYNALYTPNNLAGDDLSDFFTDKGGDWESYQTVAPTNLDAGDATDESITLTWTTIAYEYDGDIGGYEVWYRPSGGSWELFETTSGTTVTSSTIDGLSPGTNYSFRVRTLTEQHDDNPNDVYSEYATTSGKTTGEEEDDEGCFINTTAIKIFNIFR
ncbi:MAG: fibronectin type III domain-containing protein [Deltaproteobacteria bacterium]|nr:fibronectin type III domain-containing protein [Deltaproteobacteria bacterium]